jgi:hypothetical protein
MPSFVQVFSNRSSTQENTMFKTYVGGALVAMAVWFSPSPKEHATAFHGGEKKYCSGILEVLKCRGCSISDLTFGFTREAGSIGNLLPGNVRLACTNRPCIPDVATDASPESCEPD